MLQDIATINDIERVIIEGKVLASAGAIIYLQTGVLCMFSGRVQ
jgi:hypothetical protein